MQAQHPPGLLILIADDSEDNRIVFGTVLRHAGFRVAIARDGGEALEQARRERPALMVLDLKMPDLRGDEVLRRLNADPATEGIPAIIATADDGYPASRAREDGFCAHLRKPLLPNHLRRAVEHCLARWSPAERWVQLPDLAAGAGA